jgi:hypothetical protein
MNPFQQSTIANEHTTSYKDNILFAQNINTDEPSFIIVNMTNPLLPALEKISSTQLTVIKAAKLFGYKKHLLIERDRCHPITSLANRIYTTRNSQSISAQLTEKNKAVLQVAYLKLCQLLDALGAPLDDAGEAVPPAPAPRRRCHKQTSAPNNRS